LGCPFPERQRKKGDINMQSKTTQAVTYRLARSKGRTTRRSEQAPVQITLTNKSSPKISFSIELMEELDWPRTIQVGFSDTGIVVGYKLDGAHGKKDYFKLRQQSRYFLTYSAPLVREIQEEFQLCFKDKVSLKFQDVEFFKESKRWVAHIPLR